MEKENGLINCLNHVIPSMNRVKNIQLLITQQTIYSTLVDAVASKSVEFATN